MSSTSIEISDQSLVADFQSAYIALATSSAANQEAARSEQQLVEQLSYWTGGNYLQPGAIDKSVQDTISRASLDAHVKKVQAQQFENANNIQLADLIHQDQVAYVGKKVVISSLPNVNPFDAVWFNEQTGYRSNTIKKRQIKGTIQEVILERNILVIKPTLLSRIIPSELSAYFVYVINPETALPMVDLKF